MGQMGHGSQNVTRCQLCRARREGGTCRLVAWRYGYMLFVPRDFALTHLLYHISGPGRAFGEACVALLVFRDNNFLSGEMTFDLWPRCLAPCFT